MEEKIKPTAEKVYELLQGLDELLENKGLKEVDITLFGSGAVGIYSALGKYFKSRFGMENYEPVKSQELGIKGLAGYLEKNRNVSEAIKSSLRETKDLDLIVDDETLNYLSMNLNKPINVAFMEGNKYVKQILISINGVGVEIFSGFDLMEPVMPFGMIGKINFNVIEVGELYLMKNKLSKKNDEHAQFHEKDSQLIRDEIVYIKSGIEQPAKSLEEE